MRERDRQTEGERESKQAIVWIPVHSSIELAKKVIVVFL